MAFILINYAEEYFKKAQGGTIPVRWGGKFVLVNSDKDEFLILSPKELTPYHADIVQRFSEEKGLAGTFHKPQKRFDIEEPGWAVNGGGKFEIDVAIKTLRFYDNSMAYGRFEAKALMENVESVKELSGYRIKIE